MARNCLAVRHVAFEDLGLLGPLVAARGYDIRYHEPASIRFEAARCSSSPILSSCWAARSASTRRETYPFVTDEIAAVARAPSIEQADARHLPRRADDGGGAWRTRRAGAGQGDRLGAADVDGSRPDLGAGAARRDTRAALARRQLRLPPAANGWLDGALSGAGVQPHAGAARAAISPRDRAGARRALA